MGSSSHWNHKRSRARASTVGRLVVPHSAVSRVKYMSGIKENDKTLMFLLSQSVDVNIPEANRVLSLESRGLGLELDLLQR